MMNVISKNRDYLFLPTCRISRRSFWFSPTAFFYSQRPIPKDPFFRDTDPRSRFFENVFPECHPKTPKIKPEVV